MQIHAAHISPRLVLSLAPGEFRLPAPGYPIQPVETIDVIRHANFLALLARERTIQAFANRIERSHSQVSQIKNRHAHSTGGKARALGDELCRHIELKLELPPGWMDQQHSSDGLSIRPEDQEMSQPQPDHEPQKITWEFMLSAVIADLPIRFRLPMPDDAMAPDTPRGTVLVFDRQQTPAFGHGVLVQDAAGLRHVRRYAQGPAGRWKAEARNSAYLSLDSADGLQVLAVVVARETREI